MHHHFLLHLLVNMEESKVKNVFFVTDIHSKKRCCCSDCYVRGEFNWAAKWFDDYKIMGVPLEYGKTRINMETFIKATEILPALVKKSNVPRRLENTCMGIVKSWTRNIDELPLPALVTARVKAYNQHTEDERCKIKSVTAYVPVLLLCHQGMCLWENV